MECEIFRRGEIAGTLTVTEDGLYRVLRGSVPDDGQILRLYLFGRSFGVFMPEAGALVLRRRISRARLPELPPSAVAWCEADGLWQRSGGLLYRYTPLGREVAVPWQIRSVMEFPAAPERLRAERIAGAYHLVFPAGINR